LVSIFASLYNQVIVMSGNYWQHFVPYQSDIRRAFDALRQSMFEHGEYQLTPPPFAGITFEEYCQYYAPEPVDSLPDEQRAEYAALFQRWSTPFEPKTIDELLEWNHSEGTGTPLDITVFAEYAAPGAMGGLTSDQLAQVFGTTEPTRNMIEEARGRVLRYISGRGSGIYIVIYRDSAPDEIFFAGITGD
jgi:hypothetical protein